MKKTRTLLVLFCAIPALFFLTGSPSLQALALLWPLLWFGVLTLAFAVRFVLDAIHQDQPPTIIDP